MEKFPGLAYGQLGVGKTQVFETAFLTGSMAQELERLQQVNAQNQAEYNRRLSELEEKKVAEKNMATLFEVIVVDRKGNLIATSGKVRNLVVAADEQDATFEANVDTALRQANLKPKDVTIICRNLGPVELEKPVQRVQLIKEAE